MSRYWDRSGNYSQPSASTLKRNINQTQKTAKKKGTQLDPIVVEGRKIVLSWWGQAWCDNLERYADYESRLARGKRYVRSGTVVDLKIEKGKILARVQGNRKTPYKIEIRISPLSEERCQGIIQRSGNRIDSLAMLIDGDFPRELKDLFMDANGLFPRPNEISLNCSCPDWAMLCKHVAATLYGVGVRLDRDPLMFFRLRGIDVERFIDVTIASKVESMLENINPSSSRIIHDADALEVFGVL
jgi:uncharacterized Zn finger protein